jgi:hypothetical protein
LFGVEGAQNLVVDNSFIEDRNEAGEGCGAADAVVEGLLGFVHAGDSPRFAQEQVAALPMH